MQPLGLADYSRLFLLVVFTLILNLANFVVVFFYNWFPFKGALGEHRLNLQA